MRLAILSGMPTSCAMVRASSSARVFSAAEIFSRSSALFSVAVWLHVSSAPRAAPTAASMSFSVPAGTRPITAPVPALCTSMVSRLEGASHWPPMKNLSRISILCPGSKERLPAEAAEGSAYCSRRRTDRENRKGVRMGFSGAVVGAVIGAVLYQLPGAFVGAIAGGTIGWLIVHIGARLEALDKRTRALELALAGRVEAAPPAIPAATPTPPEPEPIPEA